MDDNWTSRFDIKTVLAFCFGAGFFVVLLALFIFPLPKDNSQMANTVIVALISMVSMVVGYYFGSSEGSAKKTEIIALKAETEAKVEAETTPPDTQKKGELNG
jgi:uncharacterized protein YacL